MPGGVMPGGVRLEYAKTVVAIVCLSPLIYLLTIPRSAHAHGTMLIPASRIHKCRFNGNPENHQDPACRAAIAQAGTQPIYDWNGIRQGDANSQHEMLIADGQHCSGGNPTFRGMDVLQDDWRTSPIIPDAQGQFEFVYQATAPHATKDMIFYVTPHGFDPSQPIRWEELEEFCRHGPVPLTDLAGKSVYRMTCPVPQRTGRHVIFHIWQRADSPEAFYACSDVDFVVGTNPDASLRQIGAVVASPELPVGTMITFRLFDANATDVERVSMRVEENQGAPHLWPFFLGQKVNAESQLARIGVVTEDGRVEPTQELNANLVFAIINSDISFVIDKDLPDEPDDSGESGDDTFDFVYPDGRGRYEPGTIVKATDGNLYQCKPFPFSGWCNQDPFYYEPGRGLAWSEAWVSL